MNTKKTPQNRGENVLGFSSHSIPQRTVDPGLILDQLDKVSSKGKGRYIACCPAHKYHSPSLQVNFETTDGRVLLHCFAGCSINDICAAIGLDVRDLFPRTSRHRYDQISDWKLQRIRSALALVTTRILIFESDTQSGKTISDSDIENYKADKERERALRAMVRI